MNIRERLVKTPAALADILKNLTTNKKVLIFSDDPPNETETTKPSKKAVGATGTKIWGETFQEEYLSALKGYAGSQIYDEMPRKDYQIKYIENAVLGPIKTANYTFTIPNTPKGELIAKACTWQLVKGFDKTHQENMSDICSYITHGFAPFEITDWQPYNHKEFGLIWRLASLGFREQKTIYGWKVQNGKIIYLRQVISSDIESREVKIPGEQLLVLTHDGRGDNLEGVSIFRAAYGPYWRKNIYLKLLGIGLEKSALGIIVVTVPPNKVGSADEDNFLEAVKNYITHQNSYLKKISTGDGDGFNVEVIKIDFNANSVTEAIKAEDLAISKAVGAQFSENAKGGNGGAYNFGVAEMDFYLNTIANKARYICEKLQIVFDQFVDYNFGEQDEYPQLIFSGINDIAGIEQAQTLNYLTVSGYITPQEEDEIFLRKKYGMPQLVNPWTYAPAPTEGDEAEPKANEDEDNGGSGEAGQKGNDDDNDLALSKREKKYINKVLKGIDVKTITKEKIEAQEGYFEAVNKVLMAIETSYTLDIRRMLKGNPKDPMKELRGIEFTGTRALYDEIETQLDKSINTGKKQGRIIAKSKRDKMKISDAINPDNKKWIKNTASVAAVTILDTMKRKALISGQTEIDKGSPAKAIEFAITNTLDNWRSNAGNLGGGAVIPKAFENGRDEAYASAGVELTGWLYQNLDPVTEICMWLDGRAAKDGDPDVDTYGPPNHWGCDSVKIPIFSDEDQPDDWDGWDVPPSVAAAQELLSHKHSHYSDEWHAIIKDRRI